LTERYKCHTCKLILKESDLIEECCPICHNKDGLQKMCKLDHNNCSHNVLETIAFCPECGCQCCPECGSHDVVQISRVTGYLQEVGGWNMGKQQELRDRQRYTI
jgi:anaerobic ribonucleoside-triphosphate reductase